MAKRERHVGPLMPHIERAVEKARAERKPPETPGERIDAIFEDVKLRTELTEGTMLGVDPRSEFRAAIDLARGMGDGALVSSVYDRVIEYHGAGGFNFEAGRMAIEAGRTEKALEMIGRLVDSRTNPDYRGARQLAEMMGPEHLAGVEARIEEKKKALDGEAMSRFKGKEQTLSDVVYVTRSGSRYQVNQDGILFKNRGPLILSGTVYEHLGVADRKVAFERIMDVAGYGGESSQLTQLQAAFQANERYHFVDEVAYRDVGGRISGMNALAGINREMKELFLTSPIDRAE